MNYSSINEKGVKKYNVIMALPVGARFVTRRTKPQLVGALRAVCSGRGKKAGCYGRVISCEEDEKWSERELPKGKAEEEARLECFYSWDGLWEWIRNAYPKLLPKLYRIEFEKVA